MIQTHQARNKIQSVQETLHSIIYNEETTIQTNIKHKQKLAQINQAIN